MESIHALKRQIDRQPDHLWAHAFLAFDYSFLGDGDGARTETAEIERPLRPAPLVLAIKLAAGLVSQGKSAEALVALDKAARFDSRDTYVWAQGWAYSQQGHFKEAIASFQRYLAGYPNDYWAHAMLAGDYIELAQNDVGRAKAAKALKLNPQLTVAMIAPTGSLNNKAHPLESERFRADLRKAGLK